MPTFEPELIITQSLMDRLTDEDPSVRRDPPVTRAQSFRQFKTSLRRDLEWLLNTRRTPEAVSNQYSELSRSLFNYGLPDLSSLSVQSTNDRNRLVESLREAVEKYEPRLDEVRITAEPVQVYTRMLRFHIDALAHIDPAPEQVSFDTVLELTSGEYEVK